MAAWLETSRRLLTSVGDHALNLNNDAIGFAELERETVAYDSRYAGNGRAGSFAELEGRLARSRLRDRADEGDGHGRSPSAFHALSTLPPIPK